MLLIRISRPRVRDCHVTLCESSTDVDVEHMVDGGVRCNGRGRGRGKDKDKDKDKDMGRGRDRDKERDRCRGRVGPPECLDVADILGCSWDVLIDAGDEINDGGQVNENSLKKGVEQLKNDNDDEDCETEANISTSIQSHKQDKSSVVKTKGRYNKWRKKKSQDNDNEDLQSLGVTKKEQEQAVTSAGGHVSVSSKVLSKVFSGSFFQAMKKKKHTDSPVVIDISVTADDDADADAVAVVFVDEMSLSDALSEPLQEVKKKKKKTASNEEEEEEEEEDALPSHTVVVGENGQGFPDTISDPDPDPDIDPDLTPSAVQLENDKASDRFVCTLADLILPVCDVCSQNQNQGNSHSKDITGNCNSINSEVLPQMTSTSLQAEGEGSALCNRGTVYEGWKYECMMVEVKGPTDSLADHQLMWLCVLSSSNIATFVAHVKETSIVE